MTTIDRLGFTGTRQGMTLEQNRTFRRVLADLAPSRFGHGFARGADRQAHWTTRKWAPRVQIHGFPVRESDFWSGDFLEAQRMRRDCAVVYPYPESCAPELERNRWIVSWCTTLVATPHEATEKLRSGTWATIRYARKSMVGLIVICPDGRVLA